MRGGGDNKKNTVRSSVSIWSEKNHIRIIFYYFRPQSHQPALEDKDIDEVCPSVISLHGNVETKKTKKLNLFFRVESTFTRGVNSV